MLGLVQEPPRLRFPIFAKACTDPVFHRKQHTQIYLGSVLPGSTSGLLHRTTKDRVLRGEFAGPEHDKALHAVARDRRFPMPGCQVLFSHSIERLASSLALPHDHLSHARIPNHLAWRAYSSASLRAHASARRNLH